MKKRIRNSGLSLLTIISFGLFVPKSIHAQPGQEVSSRVFYDNLSPYGRWILDPQYGSVWIPDVEEDFSPYSTRGHWVMTEYGNTWVSDYEWGWAPFHYGRWHLDNYNGWEWIPGEEWSPAWVSWRSGGGYYGWSPLEPGMGVNISINIPWSRWTFVPEQYICSPHIHSYYLSRPRYEIYRNTTYIYNNHRYYSGPQREDLERATHSRITVYNMRDYHRPGTRVKNGWVDIYRPNVAHNRDGYPRMQSNRNYYEDEQRKSGNNYSRPNRESQVSTQARPPYGTRGGYDGQTERSDKNHNSSQPSIQTEPQIDTGYPTRPAKRYGDENQQRQQPVRVSSDTNYQYSRQESGRNNSPSNAQPAQSTNSNSENTNRTAPSRGSAQGNNDSGGNNRPSRY